MYSAYKFSYAPPPHSATFAILYLQAINIFAPFLAKPCYPSNFFTRMIETSNLSITLIADGERGSSRGVIFFDQSEISHSIAVILGPLVGVNLIESDINWSGNSMLVEQRPAEDNQLEKVSLH